MHTFIGKKSYRWIGIAVNREGKKYLTFVAGDRSTATGQKLWDKIKRCSDDENDFGLLE
ncbi:MAG: hypothetical protein LBF88_00005 [Planctomycetaceae bacterium]|jgi:IS1 family transposase|nr:hypothetical protein [Planctomycetaceae bacterium]